MWPPLVAELLPKTTFPPAGTRLTCAVSGGSDSLALLALAKAAGCDVRVVHVDHGIRGPGTAETELVGKLASMLGTEFSTVTLSVQPGPNLEARARAARFASLPADVATGHTMDDQAETVLGNLLRGAGTDGLAGMRSGPLHPLLGVRRFETTALCQALGWPWFEDPTNRDRRFLRNRIRHELLPLCCELARRDVVPVLARQAELLAEESDVLDAVSAQCVPDPTDARTVAMAPLPAARRAVRRWIRSARPSSGGRHDARAGGQADGHHPPSLAEVDRVIEVARGAAVATQLEGGVRVRRSQRRLYLEGE